MVLTPRVLIVDDDRRILSMLSQFLHERGLAVTQAENAKQATAALKSQSVDLVVLDVLMPGQDGFTLCKRIRQESDVPIILLTAINDVADRITGLELGADDYVPKPFDPRELLARIRAVLRRRTGDVASPRKRAIYHFEGWTLDPQRRTLRSVSDVLVDLTSGEFDLLLAFIEYPQQVLDRERLLDLARGRSNQVFDRSIDVQVSRLRRKLEANPADPLLIKTVRNGGYIFTPHVRVEHA